MARILELKLSLQHLKPLVWRQIRVNAQATFEDLHLWIQIMMDWHDSHLAEFQTERYLISVGDPFGAEEVEGTPAGDVRLFEIFNRKGSKARYVYDFGDYWEIDIVMTDSQNADQAEQYPLLLDGAMSGPLEDSGGPFGYEDFLQILNDPGHPEYSDIKEWAGEDFDPRAFDLERIQEELWASEIELPMGEGFENLLLSGNVDEMAELMEQLGMDIHAENAMEQIHTLIDRMGGKQITDLNPPDGWSYEAFSFALNEPFDESAAIRLSFELPAELLLDAPFYKLCRVIMLRIASLEPLPLTSAGNLPRHLLTELDALQIIEESSLEYDFGQIPLNEVDYQAIHATRLLLESEGLIENQRNKLYLTDEGHAHLRSGQESRLFSRLFESFFQGIQWSYFDGYGDHLLGQYGFNFLLWQLRHFGTVATPLDFYCKSYLEAMPFYRLAPIMTDSGTVMDEDSLKNCIQSRCFSRAFLWWGLVSFPIVRKQWVGSSMQDPVVATSLLNLIVST